MPSAIYAIILGVVEGITEFLPISSTGHLVVLTDILSFRDTEGTFEIGIQFGAVLAVAWFYRKSLFGQAKALMHDPPTRRFWLGIILAFIPAGVVGFFLADYITTHLFSPQVVAVSLIVGGVILWLVEIKPRKSRTAELGKVTLRQAIAIGVAQISALIPGVSRSGATIVGGMLGGLDRPTATAFSFYLALPTLGVATIYALLKDISALDAGTLGDIAIGMAVSFITALAAISWLLRYVSRNDFKVFAIYRILLGAAILIFFALR